MGRCRSIKLVDWRPELRWTGFDISSKASVLTSHWILIAIISINTIRAVFFVYGDMVEAAVVIMNDSRLSLPGWPRDDGRDVRGPAVRAGFVATRAAIATAARARIPSLT